MGGRILVTGGAGYIGSHTVVELLQAGHEVVVLDNLANASPEALRRVEAITGRPAPLVVGDLRDEALLSRLLAEHRFDATIHFAGLKAVGESVAKPLEYYDCNVAGTVTLLRCLDAAGVRRLVFSSSATVYGDPSSVPIREDAATGPTNPYGRTKWMIEFILQDLAAADPRWSVGNLRYFNPVGAHPSGRIGEDPQGVPNNLMPFVAQVAVGRREKLSVFGGDWPTPDGTGVRDYIHVVDLAQGHLAALRRCERESGYWTVNLGTGTGYSVLDMVRAFERASGRPVPYEIVARRPGDIASCYADPAQAERLLGWRARLGIDEMCADGWRWQSGNPQGYRG
ncbi:MAG TPA: UDP-glucose 4-epimerase GalE [Burkholderiaceae bacterium]|nr:UDP-glucose 4-epimerase GalE [Burkholderiaceae bacterium]